jgi:hypothetical protein
MSANAQLDESESYKKYEDGVDAQPLTTDHMSYIKLLSWTYERAYRVPIYIINPADIADIVEDNIKLANQGERFNIEKVDNEIYKYFKEVAKIFNETLKDKTELPKIIDFLKQKGYINENVWKNLLDLLLILDGLSLQDEILNDDLKLLQEIAVDLRKEGFPRFNDSSNLLPLYIEMRHIKRLNGSSFY